MFDILKKAKKAVGAALVAGTGTIVAVGQPEMSVDILGILFAILNGVLTGGVAYGLRNDP